MYVYMYVYKIFLSKLLVLKRIYCLLTLNFFRDLKWKLRDEKTYLKDFSVTSGFSSNT